MVGFGSCARFVIRSPIFCLPRSNMISSTLIRCALEHYQVRNWPPVRPRKSGHFGQKKAYGTRDSQAVSHPGTNRARPSLTSVFGREPVLSRCYGRRRRCGNGITLHYATWVSYFIMNNNKHCESSKQRKHAQLLYGILWKTLALSLHSAKSMKWSGIACDILSLLYALHVRPGTILK